MCRLYNWIKRFLMGKINNITAYEPTTPTATTILIGSEDSDGATRNYLVSALATYMSSNITALTDLTLSGFLTVGGATTLSSTLDVTGATTLSSTLDVTGNTTIGGDATIGGQLLVSGLLQVGSFTMTGVPIFFNGINVGGTLTASGLPKLTGLSTFADNAAALGGGLVANDVYKTATGELRIVV